MRSSCCRTVKSSFLAVCVGFLAILAVVEALASSTPPSSSATTTRNTAIVTGASGYVGKAIVHQLLLDNDENHYDDPKEDEIICLVRPRRVEQETKYWNSVLSCRPTVKVRVLPYDMLDGGVTLQQALKETIPWEADDDSSDEDASSSSCSCVVVYHVASVFGPTEDHRTTALDNVKGTEDVVRTMADFVAATTNANANCKLVVTSSMAAVRASGQEPANGKFYTEADWNTISQLGQNWGASYQWSKAESERRARELSQACGIPMVSLCPSFVFGPPLDDDSSSSSSYSIDLVGQWARGESPVQSRLYVDNRDLAAAHVAAGRRIVANGKRYIVSTQARVPSEEIAEWLKQVCREMKRDSLVEKIHYDAEFSGGAIPVGQQEVECTTRLEQELGVKLRPVKDTIVDMAKRLLLLQDEEAVAAARTE